MSDTLGFMDLSRQIKANKAVFMKTIEKVVDESAFSGGRFAKEFEKRFAGYIGSACCSSVNSGTTALYLAFLALGIGAGDEVIIPANTFIASAWPTLYTGATPVFCDMDPDTWELDQEDLERRITDRTKAIVMVHLYGQVGDFDAVKAIAKKHGIFIIEDCAQAHGAAYSGQRAGTLGDIACFSFYPGKNLGAFGEAGAVTTNHEAYYKKIEVMKNHGSERQYYHDSIGFNMRMDGIQGAVLSCKLDLLDGWNDRRRKIGSAYNSGIQNTKIKKQKVLEKCLPAYHLYEIEVDDRASFMEYMKKNGIVCGIHYPVPCHLQKAFSGYGFKEGDLPVSERHAKHCVSIPMFPELLDSEVEKVIHLCNAY